jgi:hypothetical protein
MSGLGRIGYDNARFERIALRCLSVALEANCWYSGDSIATKATLPSASL